MRALVLVVLLSGGAARAQVDADPWLGPDKALHFAASAGLAGVGYVGTAFLTDDVSWRLFGGAALSLTAGAVKELLDLAGLGTPSWKDFVWDVLGCATGLLTSWLIDRFVVTPLAQPRPAGASP